MEPDRCQLLCLDLDTAEALRAEAPSRPEVEALAVLAKGIADPLRLRLALALCDGGELCVCDLSWIVDRAENLVSHHLRRMRASGVARSRREGRTVLYSLTEHGEQILGAVARPGVAP